MPGFLKRLILACLDRVIRVVLHRVDLIKGGAPAKVARAGADSAGWRTMRVRPFVYSAPAAKASEEFPKYFLVTSQGLAASAWLASSLNLHPDITCAMGIDHPLVSMRFYYNENEIAEKQESIRNLGPMQNGFYSETLRQHFKEKFARLGVPLETDLVRENPIRQLQRMYEELAWFDPHSKYIGNVHVCFAQQALEYLAESPTNRNVTLVNLIRHPIPRTEAAIKGVLSIATHYKDSDWHKGIPEGMDAIVDTEAERRREIERRFGVDFKEPRNRAVLYSYYRALHNDCWGGEIVSIREACHVTIERLMSDRNYFSWLVSELTGHEVVPASDFLDKIFTETHLQSGRHMGKGRSIGPREQYAAWTDWERFEFRQVMERLDLTNVYAPFGYDFSFVR